MTNEFVSTAPCGDVESISIITRKKSKVKINKGDGRMKKDGELSLEQLRQKLHISKRKAAWMLQNGVIPCRIVDTPTHLRYYVKEEDLRAYMKHSITESKKEFTRGQFSSRNKDAPETDEASGDEISVYSYLSKKDRNKFERMLEKRLAIYPDAMTVKRVVDIIGYSDKTIRWHINKGRIFTILQDRKFLVSKYSLIKFLASDKGFAMQPKSEWHEKAIRWFIKEMYKG